MGVKTVKLGQLTKKIRTCVPEDTFVPKMSQSLFHVHRELINLKKPRVVLTTVFHVKQDITVKKRVGTITSIFDVIRDSTVQRA